MTNMNGAPEAKGKGEQNPISPENVENKVLTSEEEAQRMEQMDEKYAKTSEKKADMATLGKIESSLPSDVQALKNKTLIKLSNGRFLCLGVDEKGYNIGVLLSLSVDANNLENGGLKIADSEYIDTKEDKAVMAQLGVDEAEFRKIIYFEDKWVDENTDRKNAEKAKEEIDKQINKITEEYFTNKISPLDKAETTTEFREVLNTFIQTLPEEEKKNANELMQEFNKLSNSNDRFSKSGQKESTNTIQKLINIYNIHNGLKFISLSGLGKFDKIPDSEEAKFTEFKKDLQNLDENAQKELAAKAHKAYWGRTDTSTIINLILRTDGAFSEELRIIEDKRLKEAGYPQGLTI